VNARGCSSRKHHLLSFRPESETDEASSAFSLITPHIRGTFILIILKSARRIVT